MNGARSEEPSIRVLVVDDHDLFRAGLSSLLAVDPKIEVVAQASGGRTGVRLARELAPDVVLLDMRMPDLDGLSATRAIVKRDPNARIVVLTAMSGTTDDDVVVALEAGACGFVAKDTPVEDVAAAIHAAAHGAAWLSPRAAEVVLGHVRRSRTVQEEAPDAVVPILSARELEVLRLIAQGMENAEIAEALGISPRTVKNHVSSVLAKLHMPSRVQAAVYAVRQGLA